MNVPKRLFFDALRGLHFDGKESIPFWRIYLEDLRAPSPNNRGRYLIKRFLVASQTIDFVFKKPVDEIVIWFIVYLFLGKRPIGISTILLVSVSLAFFILAHWPNPPAEMYRFFLSLSTAILDALQYFRHFLYLIKGDRFRKWCDIPYQIIVRRFSLSKIVKYPIFLI